MLTKLKEQVQTLLTYVAALMHKAGLTPNQLSILGIVFAILSSIMYFQAQPLNTVVATFFLITSGFLDALDGVLARIYGQVSVFGGFFDSMLDRYAEACVFLGIIFGWLAPDMFWLGCGFAALVGSLLVSYSRARAEAAGVKMETVGFAERAERILILVFASLLTLIYRSALQWSMIVLAVITNLTVVQRSAYFRKKLIEKQTSPTV
jgi:archaetidylinositol phosphate synthase